MVNLFDHLARLMSDTVASTSAYAPLLLVLASFVEYIFPPFPGDTVVLLGAWYSVHGALPWPMTFAAVTTGAIAGGFVDYQIGKRLGKGLDRVAGPHRLLTSERLARFEAYYQRWGVLFLIANRFIPGIRAFLFVAAGAAHLPLGKVILCGAISAAVWNALLLLAGAILARNLVELGSLVAQYSAVATSILIVVAIYLLVRIVRSRMRQKGAREP